MTEKFKCPHCGEVIEEVSVIMLTWKRVLISVGLGIGSGLLVYPLVRGDALVSAIGAFIVAFLVAFLITRERRW